MIKVIGKLSFVIVSVFLGVSALSLSLAYADGEDVVSPDASTPALSAPATTPANSLPPAAGHNPGKITSGKRTAPMSDSELGHFQYCGEDADCIKANNGCCDCANGGADVAVSKKLLEEFNQQFECLNTACTEMAATPPCGSGVISCVNHKCRYFAVKE